MKPRQSPLSRNSYDLIGATLLLALPVHADENLAAIPNQRAVLFSLGQT